MIGEDFIFASRYLSEFDMRMYDPEEEQQYVTTDYDSGEITSLRSKPNYYSITYTDRMTLNFLICYDNDIFYNQNEFELTGDDMNMLRSWLESPKTPTELIVLGDEDDQNTHYYGVFTSVQPFMVSKKCYGLYLTFTCNAPYGYSDVHTYSCPFSSSVTSQTKKIMNSSAEWKEYLKPVITVTSSSSNGFGSGENLTIINKSDNDNTMTITLPQGIKKLIIDCEKKIVTNQDGALVSLSDLGITVPSTINYNFISTASVNFYWLSLVPNWNNLVIKTTKASHRIAKVDISMQFILKSGGI